MSDAPATVVCLCRRAGVVVQDCDVYIGRQCFRGGWKLPRSPWHNPFSVAQCGGSAAFAVERYEAYLRQRQDLLERLPQLRGKVLGCWCKKRGDEPCHGDVLVKLLKEKATSRTTTADGSTTPTSIRGE